MAHDFQFERGESFGEWLHKEMLQAVMFEDAPWAIDRIRRVEARLQADRPGSNRLRVEIPWLEEPIAFTAPGHYIYFSRRLYEVCATDEQVAFVVGHEIAHHDLGHVALFHGWTDKIIRLPGATLFALFFHGLERLLYGPHKECDADRHGLADIYSRVNRERQETVDALVHALEGYSGRRLGDSKHDWEDWAAGLRTNR